MKITLILITTLVVALADQYSDRYDEVNVEEILTNKRLFTSYLKCLLDKGRCTPEGKSLKGHISDGIETGCTKCTDIQKIKAKRVANYIRSNEKQAWDELIHKYDPEDKHKETYEAFLASSD